MVGIKLLSPVDSPGFVVLEEFVVAAQPTPQQTLFDLAMLAVAGGKERTIEEFSALFESAGLVLVDVSLAHSHAPSLCRRLRTQPA
jgi:hypothetical protein